jgi:hypothetical protein
VPLPCLYCASTVPVLCPSCVSVPACSPSTLARCATRRPRARITSTTRLFHQFSSCCPADGRRGMSAGSGSKLALVLALVLAVALAVAWTAPWPRTRRSFTAAKRATPTSGALPQKQRPAGQLMAARDTSRGLPRQLHTPRRPPRHRLRASPMSRSFPRPGRRV